MNIRILIDNNQSRDNSSLLSEHGLSILLEDGPLKCLLDVGATARWSLNARELGIDITNIDYLILSHGHADHTGGLSSFFRLNEKAKVFASDKIKDHEYFSYRYKDAVNLSPDAETLAEYDNRITYLKNDFQLSPDIKLVYNKVFNYPVPVGNKFLRVKNEQGEFPYVADDEIALSVVVNDALVIISSCSHNGMLNIIQSCIQATGINKINTFVGGLHLIDMDEKECDDVEGIAKNIKSKYQGMMIYTGHCTGKTAYRILKNNLGNNVRRMYSGMSLYIE